MAETSLLFAGLFFPIISLTTLIASSIQCWRYKKHSSAVMIPFLGPILLSGWSIVTDQSPWLIPVFWISDLGTVAFLVVCPFLIRDWWQVSWFTRILKLHGSKDIQSVIITLHSTGHYLLKKSWDRPVGEFGIVGFGEPGVFIEVGDRFELTAHHGLRRILRKTVEGGYAVEEDQPQNPSVELDTLKGWLLKP